MPLDTEACYVAYKNGCGCAFAAVVPREHGNIRLAKRVVRWMRRGLQIERVSYREAKQLLQRCPHEMKAQQADLFRRGVR